MPQSGWYNDPDGTPGRLRYWDGAQWTGDTMPHPSSDGHTATLPPVPSQPSGTAPTGAPAAQQPADAQGGQQAPDAGAGTPPYTPGTFPQGPAGATSYSPGASNYPPGASAYAAGASGYPSSTGGVPPYGQPPKKTNRAVPIIIAVAVLVLLVGLVWALTGVFRGTPTVPTTDPTTAGAPSITVAPPNDDPTESTTEPNTSSCPTSGSNTLVGGHLTVTIPTTWKKTNETFFDWTQCGMSAGRQLRGTWSTTAVTGSVTGVDYTPETIAKGVWRWNLSENYQAGGTGLSVTSANITDEEKVTVGGMEGYKLTGQVLVSGLPGIAGDDVTVLDLLNADGTHSVLLTVSTIDDATSKAEVAQVWDSLQVA